MTDAMNQQPVAERPALAEVRNHNLSKLVFESIRAAIVDRTLAPGSRLTETKLAEELNVSKTPVREALVKLREVGLIEPDGRRGGRVIRPSRRTLEDTYDIREALEVFTARRAAEVATPEQRRGISDAAARSLEGARGGDLVMFSDNDNLFHQAITAVAANARLSEMVENAFALIVALRTRDLPDRDNSIECGEEHVAIAEAIAEGEPTVAGERMRSHVEHVRGFVLAQMMPESR